jgi:Lon protease-like protein
MRRLPLFPLPLVLFPGSVTPLHIFEPRYRRMVARCLEFDREFGLLYHDAERFGPFERVPGRIGTVARIGEFRILPDGRSLLLAHGQDRFRIVDGIESDTPYAEALVEPFHDAIEKGGTGPDRPDEMAEERLVRRRRLTLTLMETVVGRLGRVEPPEDGAGALDAETSLDAGEVVGAIDPTQEVSFRVAAMIRTDPAWQHGLLALGAEVDRLDRIDELLRGALFGAAPPDGPS